MVFIRLLVEGGVKDAVLIDADGARRAGADLEELVGEALTAQGAIETLARRVGHRRAVEAAFLAGGFAAGARQQFQQWSALANKMADFMNAPEPDYAKGWSVEVVQQGEPSNERGPGSNLGLKAMRILRGVSQSYVLDPLTFVGIDAARLSKLTDP